MIFKETLLEGVFVIELELIRDNRGFFARTFCQKEFKKKGLSDIILQCSTSFNKKKVTLRGMHYQSEPYAEPKIVLCTNGAIYDVVVDLRKNSSTYKKWVANELNMKSQKMIYIPKGCAHGFQTLEDNTEVFYQMSEFYHPEYAKGIRWDDVAFNIQWPLPISVISQKDLSYPDFKS